MSRRVISFFTVLGSGPSASRTIKHLASKIAEKKDESYSDAITYIRTNNFSALPYHMPEGEVVPNGRLTLSSCGNIVRKGRPDSY